MKFNLPISSKVVKKEESENQSTNGMSGNMGPEPCHLSRRGALIPAKVLNHEDNSEETKTISHSQ